MDSQSTPISSSSNILHWAKRITTILIAIIALVALLLAIVFNFVLTPKRMTPIVQESLQEYLNSDVKISSVDFSIFSSLPKVTLNIDSLRIAQMVDGVDDLFSVDRCAVSISPLSILNKSVVINEISLRRPRINLYVDSTCRPISHIKLEKFETDEESDTTAQFSLKDYRIRLDSVRIDSSLIVINDREKDFYASMEDMSLGMRLMMSGKGMIVNFDWQFDDLLIRDKEKTYSSNLSVELQSNAVYKKDSTLVRFNDTNLSVNGINMQANGTLQGDKANKCAYIDIFGGLKTPSLKEFIDLVPDHLLQGKDSIKTCGAVDFKMLLKGTWSKTEYPLFLSNLKVNNAKVSYGNNPVTLDRVDCDANIRVDLNDRKTSRAVIKSLHINTSGIIDMNIKGEVSNILESPYIDADFDSDIDFDRLYEIAPMPDGVTLNGRNINDLHTKFHLNDIQNSNFGQLYIDGISTFKDVKFNIDGAKFSKDSTSTTFFAMDIADGSINFGDRVKKNNSRTLLAMAKCTDFGFKDRTGKYASVKNIDITMGANFDRATQKVNGVGVNAKMQQTNAGVENQMEIALGATDMTLTISPKNEERGMKVVAKIKSEAIDAKEIEYNTLITTQSADFHLDMMHLGEKRWHSEGTAGFQKFHMFSDLFPLDVNLDNSRMIINGKKVTLNEVDAEIGESRITASGYVENVISSLFFDPTIFMESQLKIKSKFLNANELIEATNKSVLMNTTDSAELASMATDSMGMMFLVPKNSKLNFEMTIDEMLYSNSKVKNITGIANIDNGILTLDKLAFGAIGANSLSAIKYYNIDSEHSNIAMNVHLRGAELNRIEEILPMVVDMFPMMESVEGVVDFHMRANTNIDKDYNVDFETLKSAVSISGKNLVLLDPVTFKDVAKTMMFKNKERNLIDEVSVKIIGEKNRFVVQPFKFTIDRYDMIIGGDQTIEPSTFDLDYKYNVSVLKSPLPFKAGIDIKGRNENFDYKVTKAKLKNTDFKANEASYQEYRKGIKAPDISIADRLRKR